MIDIRKLAAILAVLMPAVAPAAVTFEEAQLRTAVRVIVPGIDTTQEDDTVEEPYLNTLTTSLARTGPGGTSATGSVTATAAFLNGVGSLAFDMSATASSASPLTAFATTRGFATYVFEIDAAMNFSFSAATTTSGTGLFTDFDYDLRHAADTFIRNGVIGANDLSSYSFDLAPGVYTFNIQYPLGSIVDTEGHKVFASDGTASAATQRAQFSFALAALPPSVPEPATWAMMILGFGAVGGAMRSGRRRADGAIA